jgi:hypothetical protein
MGDADFPVSASSLHRVWRDEGCMCKAPVSYLTGGNTGGNTTGAGNAGNAQTPEKTVDPCDKLETRLPELPNIMDHLGWTNGAALMRDWFSRPASDKPKQNTPNIDTIKMDWVLGYQRARDVYNQAVNESVWANAAAQVEIRKLIERTSQLPANVGDIVAFGDVGAGRTFTPEQMKQFDEDYAFQQRQVFSDIDSDPLDDMFAALANFNLNFVTQGTVEYLGKDANGKDLYKVTLTQVGIYVRDSYDFNDDPAGLNPGTWVSQPLGYWDCAELDASKTPGPGAYYVDNDDFREWRDQYGNGKGGDYLVFSDIRVINVNDTFTFTR